MKKSAAAVTAAILLFSAAANAAYTQNDIQTSVNSAFDWLEQNASALSNPGNVASDFYIMALSRMNKEYSYGKYVDLTEKITPTTKQDGQRLIMSNAACGEFLSDSFVGWYTYDADFTTASDIAGAVITLDSGGFAAPNGSPGSENLAATLLTYQQSNGSFENDILSTAKSVIALSRYLGLEFEIHGENSNEMYTYNVDDAVYNAVGYLSGVQNADGGFSTVSNTVYSIIALDSVGVDADNDQRFIKNGSTPLTFLLSMQLSDGSFNSSAEDTALSACALVSHLRAMQGKSGFFNFISSDSVDTIVSGGGSSSIAPGGSSSASSSQSSGSQGSSDNSTDQPSATQNVIRVTPMPSRAPEHSSTDEEQYGPFPFVGPAQQSEQPKKAATATVDQDTSVGVIILICVGVLLILLIAAAMLLCRFKPELVSKFDIARKLIPDKKEPEKTEKPEKDLLSEIDSPGEVVPTEELYDPDFIKKLIPVDEIDSSIGSLIESDQENTDNIDATDNDNKTV